MQPIIQMLAPEEVAQIDRASRRVLHEVGIIVERQDALDVFAAASAEVDVKNNRVKIPDAVIDRSIEQCEACVKLYGRGDRKPMLVGGSNTYYGTTGFPTNLLDHDNKVRI